MFTKYSNASMQASAETMPVERNGSEIKRAVTAFREVLSRERAMAHRMNYLFSLVVIDLSGKPNNQALRHDLAQSFRKRLREVDVVGFLAADQLGAILPQTPPEHAARIVRSVCDRFPAEDLIERCHISVYPDPGGDTPEARSVSRNGNKTVATGSIPPAADDSAQASESYGANTIDEILSGRIPTWKRILDVTIATLVLLPLAPIMAAEALLIKLSSRGPILFRQQRIGHLGRPFNCLKFRTMHAGDNTAAHAQHVATLIRDDVELTKLDDRNDPRIIPFGRILRVCGLDELPQIINILRGEMSLVGPRPCTPYEHRQFVAWQRRRSESLPGLTGLWQVSGKNRTTFGRMMRLDMSYVQHRSLWMDLRIMARTPIAILEQVRDSLPGISPSMAAIRLKTAGKEDSNVTKY